MSEIVMILGINVITLGHMNETRLHKTWCCHEEWHWDGDAVFYCSKCKGNVTDEVLLIMHAFDNLN